MPGHDIIVIGGSAGGVEALIALVRGLPADLPAAVFVVVHMPASSPSMLPAILARSGPLPAVAATHHQVIKKGHIYIAPPDHHLLIEDGHMLLARGPKENLHRPAIDPLFRSAARAYGARVIGVVLSGLLDDGTSGLKTIKQQGGIAVVQDPNDAIYSSMPVNAIQNVDVDYVGPLSGMPLLLERLAKEPAAERGIFMDDNLQMENLDIEIGIAEKDLSNAALLDKIGSPSHYACPDCHGILWQIHDDTLVRFRCRVGHAYTGESMLTVHSESVENSLYAALRALEESASLSRHLAHNAAERGLQTVASRMEVKAAETEQQAALVRGLLLSDKTVAGAVHTA